MVVGGDGWVVVQCGGWSVMGGGGWWWVVGGDFPGGLHGCCCCILTGRVGVVGVVTGWLVVWCGGVVDIVT